MIARVMPEKRQSASAWGRQSGNCRGAKAAKQKIDVKGGDWEGCKALGWRFEGVRKSLGWKFEVMRKSLGWKFEVMRKSRAARAAHRGQARSYICCNAPFQSGHGCSPWRMAEHRWGGGSGS